MSVNHWGFVHSEPRVVIRTVIFVVDIIAGRQRFRAASLLPRLMSANDGLGGEPTRRSTVPSQSPPDRDDVLVPSSFSVAPPTATAVIDGRHRSLVIVPLSQTVAVIVLVLLLAPGITPIPDRDSCPRRATYGNDGGPASIRARGLSSSSARRHRRPASIHPLPPLAPLQHRRRDLRHVPLEVA